MIGGALNWVLEWHKRACPTPDDRAFQVQLGCHLEEVLEMLETVDGVDTHTRRAIDDVNEALNVLAERLKRGPDRVVITNREKFLDSLADQMVTAVGVGYRAGMQPVEALTEVDISNWTKTVDGQFQYDANGKVIKPATYAPPNLEGLY